MKKKNGFTLVEIIAAIAIMTIIGLIAVPSVIKKFNTSRIQAMTIQENKLVEAGDILLDDYCKDALDDEKKRRCKFYYQDLALSDDDRPNYSEIVKDDKKYKYICVSDIKELHYYSEELVYSGTPCQGVVVYEIDKKSNLTSDSYSYVKCEDAYRTEEKNVKIEELFKGCFDGSNATNREQTYTVTVKHVENDLGGMEISPRKTHTVKESELLDGDDDVLFSIETIIHTRNGNTYKPVLKMSGENIKFNEKKVNNKTVYEITGLPSKNLTINIVYTVEKHAIVSNFYRFVPGKDENEKSHDGVKMTGIEEQSISGYTFETMKVDIPETLDQTIGGKTEKYNLVEVWVEDSKKTLPFDGKVEVGQEDRNVDLIYQQEEFNVTYNNKGGSGCDTGRIKYNKKYKESTYCTPSKTGYTFSGWSLTDGGEVLNKEEKNLDYHDITLYAKYEPKTYVITYHIGNASSTAGATAVATSTCKYNENCVLTNFDTFNKQFPYSKADHDKNGADNYGWKFAGWTTDMDAVPKADNLFDINYSNSASFTYNIDKNLNLYAIGKRNLHINGGVNPTTSLYELSQLWNPYSTNDNYLTEVTLPKGKTISGWNFIGYRPGSNSVNGEVKYDQDDIGTPFKVKYNVWPYIRSVYSRNLKVNYNANGGIGTTNGQSKVQYYNSGYGNGSINKGANVSSVSFELSNNYFTKLGYKFSKWTEGSTSGTEYNEGVNYVFAPNVNESNSKTFYVKWTEQSYTLTFDPNGGSVSPTSKTVTYMKKLGELPIATRTGYDFVGWYTQGGTAIRDSSKYYKDNPWLYYADKYSDLYNAFGYDQIKLRNHYQDYGKTEGRRNSMFIASDVNTTASNQKFFAGWMAKTFTVSFDSNGGNAPSKSSITVSYASTYGTLPTVTRSGYSFDGWYTAKSGGTKITSSSKVSITANQTLYAHWKQSDFTVNIVSNNASYGTVSSSSVTVKSGTTYSVSGNTITFSNGATVTATPAVASGYTFSISGWSSTSGTISGDTTIVVNFARSLVSYTIAYNLRDVQMATTGSTSPTSANYGQTVTVSNPSAPGFTFKGWTVSGTGASMSGTSLTMGSSNVTLTANWEANLADYVTFLGNNYASSNSMKIDNTSDKNVRYYHREPNNYVKFNNELWRIIGVFNVSDGSSTTKRVKLVRETSLIHAVWDSSSSSINGGRGIDEWSQADTKVLLNNYYFNGSGSCKYCDAKNQSSCTKTCSFSPMTATAKAMVDNAVWYLGGLEYGGDDGDGTQTAKEAYNLERGGRSSKPYCKSKNPNSGHCNDSVTRTSSWTGAVGLIYVSDFGYASGKSECYDVDVTYNSNCGRNWLYATDEEEAFWTITHRHSNWFADAVHRSTTWTMADNTTDGLNGVRPSVYLKRSVKVTDGNGSKDKPYILK